MFLALIMFNMLINKTKKIFEDNNNTRAISKSEPDLSPSDPKYEETKQELRETIYGRLHLTPSLVV